MSAWPQLAGVDANALAHVDDLAYAARQAVGLPEGRVVLREACDAAAVRVLRRPLPVGSRCHTAMLVPTTEGFHAVVDSVVWRRAIEEDAGRWRLRFVLAHELGHTFFYRPGRPPTRHRPADRFEERFCHRFATALLVPPAVAREATLDPAGLHWLAGRYDVSKRVAAWALARAHPAMAVLWLRRAPHPVKGGDEAMRVEWAACDRFIARGESFKSPLAGLPPGASAQSTETLRLSGRQQLVHVQAWRFSSSMLAFVQPVTTPATDPLSEQMALF